jgi:hypothetical protein
VTRSYALRFLSPLISRVEGWRAGVARGAPDPHHVSSPLHVARNVRISRIARPHLLHAKAYGAYPACRTATAYSIVPSRSPFVSEHAPDGA